VKPRPSVNEPYPVQQPAGGSASRNGEARRESAAKHEHSEARGREDYGRGWAGGVTKPNQPTTPPTTPQPTRGGGRRNKKATMTPP